MADRELSERIWYGEGAGAAGIRVAMAPLAALYRAAAAARGALYDAGVFRAHAGTIPAVSVGNLTVGGTGKTPVSAMLARELAKRGAKPAIVLRGYGDDEPLVHAQLNPAVPVIVDPDRVAGIARAAAAGADVAVLDDAFQHRRAARVADIVLVSADRWPATARSLPSGPFREMPSALRRASLVVVTRKAAGDAAVARVRAAVHDAAPGVPVAGVALDLGPICRDAKETMPLSAIESASVLAISAVGDPASFAAQLTRSGARVRATSFPDHHAFTVADAERLAASLTPGERPLCTLKDFVKLAPLWPRQAPALWYVSQALTVEAGSQALDALIMTLLNARTAHL